MIEMTTLTTFLGWCAVINIALLAFSTVMIVVMRTQVAGFHGKLFGVSQSEVSKSYFEYRGNYKLATLVLNIVPYIALKIML